MTDVLTWAFGLDEDNLRVLASWHRRRYEMGLPDSLVTVLAEPNPAARTLVWTLNGIVRWRVLGSLRCAPLQPEAFGGLMADLTAAPPSSGRLGDYALLPDAFSEAGATLRRYLRDEIDFNGLVETLNMLYDNRRLRRGRAW